MEKQSGLEGRVEVYIGAEEIISPLGDSAQENFKNALLGKTGLKKVSHFFGENKPAFVGKLDSYAGSDRFFDLSKNTVQKSLKNIASSAHDDRWLLLLSTTKGDIDKLENHDLEKLNTNRIATQLKNEFEMIDEVEVISVACISGLAAVIHAADSLRLEKYDHILVLGIDLLTEFTSKGFESFFALDENQCRPFDNERKGLNLGEAAASVVLSRDAAIFNSTPVEYVSGATSNDANHISGPSRNGEGLYRAVQRAIDFAEIEPQWIDYISAHGTGTRYNDDMESVAFTRAILNEKPVNSLKGYFGHTLGASSLIEIVMGIQSMKNNTLLPTFGCESPGTSEKINVLTQPIKTNVDFMLKTASGFGGCNAAGIFKKLS
jgi:3-oxoacyl-[acyl-carrier-protein] synthase-1